MTVQPTGINPTTPAAVQPAETLEKRLWAKLETMKGPDTGKTYIFDLAITDPAAVEQYKQYFAERASKQSPLQPPSGQPSIFE